MNKSDKLIVDIARHHSKDPVLVGLRIHKERLECRLENLKSERDRQWLTLESTRKQIKKMEQDIEEVDHSIDTREMDEDSYNEEEQP